MRRLGGSSLGDGGVERMLLYTMFFVSAALISSSLLLFGFVLYLAELIGSLVGSLLIVGGVMAIVAMVIYRAALRPIFREISNQLRTIYDVADLAQTGYNWLVTKAERLLKSFMKDDIVR